MHVCMQVRGHVGLCGDRGWLPLHSLFLDHQALGICLSPVLTHQAQFGMWNRKDVWNGLNTQVESVRGSNGLGTWNDKRCHRHQAVNTS